jgi:hypothetical protein
MDESHIRGSMASLERKARASLLKQPVCGDRLLRGACGVSVDSLSWALSVTTHISIIFSDYTPPSWTDSDNSIVFPTVSFFVGSLS